MKTMTDSEARERFAETLNSVVDDREEVVITRSADPVVMVALADYQALQETAHLPRSPENARRLLGPSTDSKPAAAEHDLAE